MTDACGQPAELQPQPEITQSEVAIGERTRLLEGVVGCADLHRTKRIGGEGGDAPGLRNHDAHRSAADWPGPLRSDSKQDHRINERVALLDEGKLVGPSLAQSEGTSRTMKAEHGTLAARGLSNPKPCSHRQNSIETARCVRILRDADQPDRKNVTGKPSVGFEP